MPRAGVIFKLWITFNGAMISVHKKTKDKKSELEQQVATNPLWVFLFVKG